MLNVASTPANQSIFGVPNGYVGTETGPVPGNFGIGGPNVPMTTWAPTGDTNSQTSPANFLGFGQAPTSHGHITLKSFDFIQYQYTIPPWDDESHLKLMPDMLAWTLNEIDTELDTYHVRSLPQMNQQCSEAFYFFESLVNEGDEEALEFRRLMEMYGEKQLGQYINARNKDRLTAKSRTTVDGPVEDKVLFTGTMNYGGQDYDVASDMKKFYNMHSKDLYCYLTKWGIIHKWSFSGSVINVNRAVSLETVSDTAETDHFVNANICLAKRARVANVFGKLGKITTGSKLWVTLRRKQLSMNDGQNTLKPGPFEFVPNGDTMRDWPSPADVKYFDESGTWCQGHIYKIGVVIEPCDYNPQTTAIEGAANLSASVSANRAYECHGELPTMYVAMGFKH